MNDYNEANTELEDLISEAYVYSYPLLYNLWMIEQFVDGKFPHQKKGWNEFSHSNTLANSKDPFVSINNDTLYSAAQLDMSVGPIVLEIPESKDRYYLIQFIDAWTNNFAYLGSRGSNGETGTYFLTPPDWEGSIPEGMEQIKVPTRIAALCGRTACYGKDDILEAIKVQKQMVLEPVNSQAVPKGFPEIDKKCPKELELFEKIRTYLSELVPSEEDVTYQKKFKKLGILDTDKSSFLSIDENIRENLIQFNKKKDQVIRKLKPTVKSKITNGWNSLVHAADYNNTYFEKGTINSPEWIIEDRQQAYVQRAVAAFETLWLNNGYEAVYPSCWVDNEGEPLNGKNDYTITFKEPLPVNAFWSMTMYDAKHFYLVDNSINRYSIGDRTEGIIYNEDGSLTITVSSNEPTDTIARANWLPAPKDDFRPLIRLYLPKEELLNGSYELPGIIKKER